MKSAAMESDFISAKPKNRNSCGFLKFAHELLEQSMSPERLHPVPKSERDVPVPRKLRQKLPPSHCQLTTHREDTLLPSSNVHVLRQRTTLISVAKTHFFISALSMWAARAARSVLVASRVERSGQARRPH